MTIGTESGGGKPPKAAEVTTVSVSVPAASVVEPGSLAALEVEANKTADKTVNVAEGAARSKKAFEEGQVPGQRGRSDDGKPSADDNAAANDRIRAAGLASVVDFEAIRVKQNNESHERMARAIATDSLTRLGFNPNDHAVKYTGDDARQLAATGKLPGATEPVATAGRVTPVVTPTPPPTPPVVVP